MTSNIFGHSILYTEATQQQSSKSRQRHFCIIEIVSSTYTKIELMSGQGLFAYERAFGDLGERSL